MADTRRLIELGMVPPVASELGAQIDAKVGNPRRLIELGVPAPVASILSQQVASTADANRLAEIGIVPALAGEIARQIGGTPTPSPTLNALTVSNGSGTTGSPFASTISGKTASSTIALVGAGAAGLSVSGTTISGTPTTAGSVDLVETLAGATNSPRTTSGLITVSSAAAATAFAPNQSMVYQGDSITADFASEGWVHWLEYYTFGRFMRGAGARQAISGSEIAENNDAKDILRTDRLNQFAACLSTGQAGLHAIGTNGGTDETLVKAGFDTLWSTIRGKGAAIIGATILPSTSNVSSPLRAALNAYIRARRNDPDFLLIDGAAAWGEDFTGKVRDGLHPTVGGAQIYGRAGGTELVAKGYPLGVPYGQGGTKPSDSLSTVWDFSGTGGTKAGANSANIVGNVPTGVTVTLVSAGVTATVSVVNITVPILTPNGSGGFVATDTVVPALQIDLIGTASAQAINNVIIVNGTNSTIGDQAGSLYDLMMYMRCGKATDPSVAPAGITLGMQGNTGAIGQWAGVNAATGAGTVTEPMLGGVMRTQSTNSSQVVGTNAILFQFRQDAGAVDARIVLAMPYFKPSERTNYGTVLSAHTSKDDLGGPVSGPRVTTAANSTAAWTVTAGAVTTLVPGQAWRGGGITLERVFEKSPDKIAITQVAKNAGLTNTFQAGDGFVRIGEGPVGGPYVYTPWSTNSI